MRVCTGEERGGGWEPGVCIYINRERERERERQTDRQTDRQTVESTERNIYMYVYMHREKDGGKIQRVHGLMNRQGSVCVREREGERESVCVCV